MSDRAGIGPDSEIPEADAVEQHRGANFDDEAGLDTTYLSGDARNLDANEADLIDQAMVVPVSDDYRD
ncbi:hypothetical protein [Mycobacterium spongiae]|uniref:DUF5709 domain-containing protein n=1 Tax=Mycobacterium spongiae TaxID=886343 RepID=A0A975JVX4_9MYCO|nr:hypothetical protein [Mycobacterium spongiae]QUR66677.1 hypothetical protein F6B93_05815 [Mycobacterium spongiae]